MSEHYRTLQLLFYCTSTTAVWLNIHKHTHPHAHTRAHTRMHARTHTATHTHTHTHARVHTHTKLFIDVHHEKNTAVDNSLCGWHVYRIKMLSMTCYVLEIT